MRKIDMHCHFTPRLDEAKLIYIEKQMEIYNIEKTVLLATYFPFKGTGISNYRLYEHIRKNPKFEMFASLDMQTYAKQGINEIVEMIDKKIIKGIKIYPGYQNMFFQYLNEIFYIANEADLPVMFHTGECVGMKNTNVNPFDLNISHLKTYDVKIIMSHLSCPHYENLKILMRKNKNIYTDTSGLLRSKTEKDYIPEAIIEIKKFYEEFGPNRIFFGTDSPIQNHQDSVYILKQAVNNESDLEQIFYFNAKKLLKDY